jgi:hypothetical protein
MPNPDTGNLLLNVIDESKTAPSTIILGHISSQRNKRNLAIGETVGAFAKAGRHMNFELLTAPLKQCSEVIKIT